MIVLQLVPQEGRKKKRKKKKKHPCCISTHRMPPVSLVNAHKIKIWSTKADLVGKIGND